MFLSDISLAAQDYKNARNMMLEEIEQYTNLTSDVTKISQLDKSVMNAMAMVPRHEFVLKWDKDEAYENRPLAIGHGQTISQPFIVALMTHLLNIKPDSVILEIGTGSGYQAAVLAELSQHVYSIEIIKPLAEKAKNTLIKTGYARVNTKTADGYYGWEEVAPFDGIIVTAAATHVPPPLIDQLKPGGRMVIPVGSQFLTQHLLVVDKDLNSKITTRIILPVSFVPLTGSR